MKVPSLALLISLAPISASQAATTFASTSIYIRNDGPAGNQNADVDVEDIIGWNTSQELRGLYQFSLAQIVNDVNTLGGGDFANLTINSVTLTLFERRSLASSFQIDAYAYGFNFNEGVAVWNDADGDGSPTTGDMSPGGSFGALLSSGTVSFTTTGADNDSFTFASSTSFRNAMLTAAQGDGTLELILDRTGAATATPGFLSFSSDEQGGTRRPMLTFDYTVVPEPASALLGNLGLLALLSRRR
jgi:hypothetical protein